MFGCVVVESDDFRKNSVGVSQYKLHAFAINSKKCEDIHQDDIRVIQLIDKEEHESAGVISIAKSAVQVGSTAMALNGGLFSAFLTHWFAGKLPDGKKQKMYYYLEIILKDGRSMIVRANKKHFDKLMKLDVG